MHIFGEYENALVRLGQNFGYILKINRWLIVLVYKRHIQKCAILPNRPQDAEMAGDHVVFFRISIYCVCAIANPLFHVRFQKFEKF